MLSKYLLVGSLFLCTQFSFVASSATPNNDPELMLRQISMLEKALAPKSPKGLALAWAEAVKNRNGAVQYMLECSALQKVNRRNFMAMNWVTGVSSPWVASYEIKPQQAKDNVWKFIIKYKLTSSSPINWSKVDDISVVRLKNNTDTSQGWCISELKQH